MPGSASMPTWSELFGSPDTKQADPGRAVTAPAAYLADLLQLLKDRFDPSDFRGRRPDIPSKILLNGYQAFTLVRQLDIANQVLGDRIASLAKKPADDVLAEAQQPFLLPFEYPHEQVRQLLLLLQTSYRELYTSCAQNIDIDVVARERLGLSPERAATVVQDLSGEAAKLGAVYGLAQGEKMASLADLDGFQLATQLDGPTLSQLLFSQLSEFSFNSGGVSEQDAAPGQLFINHDLGGFANLDANELRLIWSVAGKDIPDAWFDRVHRLLSLSRWTGIDLPSLDLALRQLCGNKLDLNALRRLAVLVDLRDRTQAPLDVLCALFGEIDGTAALGDGDDSLNPASLFNREFNGAAALLATSYLPSGSDFVPQEYAGWRELKATGDVLLDNGDNKEIRTRVQTSLGISAFDLAAVITCFRDQAASRGAKSQLEAMDSRSLSVLHRVVSLANFVDLAPLDLLQLVDVLQKDQNLKVLNAFDVLCHEDMGEADLYQVLEQGSVEARSWLIQNVVAIATWASAAGLAPADLAAIVVVPGGSTTEQEVAARLAAQQTAIRTAAQQTTPRTAAQQRALLATAQENVLLATAQALVDAFLPTAITAESLQSDAINERTAGIALAAFQQPKSRLVASADARLATWDKHRARDAAYAALGALDVVSVDDIQGLQLGEDLATYLQSLLIRRGVLDANGVLQQEKLPLQAQDLVLEPDGTAQFGQIFDLLNGLYTTALSDLGDTQDQQTAGDGSDGSDMSSDDMSDASASAGADTSDQQVVTAGDGADDSAASDSSDGSDNSAGDNADAVDMSAPDAQAAPPDAADVSATQDDPSTEIELNLYPSDLLTLGFSTSDAGEWIDRLTFLRVLDSTGMVLDPSIFSDPANRDGVQIKAGLDSFCGEILAWLAVRRDTWLSAKLKLPNDIWDALPLSAAERQDLEQNLIFNDHIDGARQIVDKPAVQGATADIFELGLEFYRHRRAILKALQQVVESSQQTYLSVGPDDLQPLMDKFSAIDIHGKLADAYLDAQMRLSPAIVAEIANPQPPFDFGSAYSSVQCQTVWTLLQQINTDASQFRLTDAALATVNITDDHATNVVVSLCADNYLQPDRSLTPEQVRHFSVVSSAQTFVIPQYVDYSRDVFFLIHDVAVATGAAVKALTASLKAAVGAQEQAVVAALASQVQLSPEATTAILRPLLRGESNLTVAIMAPVLQAVVDGVLTEVPGDRMFCTAMTRTQAFANFAGKLRMSPGAIQVAFRDQQLVDKFPEGIELPAGVDGIDALWAGPSGRPSGSIMFSPGDFLNLTSLAGKLQQPSRPIDVWLAAQLRPETVAALATYSATGSNAVAVESALLQDINKVLVGASIYDTQRFYGVTFRQRVQNLLLAGVQNISLPDFNRLLIEDAYPQELARNQIYLFRGPHYWTFDANSLELDEGPLGLDKLCADFKGLAAIDAVYTLPAGDHWLLAGGNVWRRAADSDRWLKPPVQTTLHQNIPQWNALQWGRVLNNFDDPLNIDGTLLDHDGRIHLFCGDQYVRYSKWTQEFVDEGYPKKIAAHWSKELGLGPLPSGWDEGIDAAVQRGDEVTWLFKDDHYVASTDPSVQCNIVDFWGQVRNNLGAASQVDAVLEVEGRCGIVSGDQISMFSSSLDSDGLTADEGYPRLITAVLRDLPEPFDQGFDAGLTDADGTMHLFRDQKCASRNKDGKWESVPTNQHWGLVHNALQDTGNVDAAFTGLDGKVYLFSGKQYVRYSGTDLSRIDEGYPKTISPDWGGLSSVDIAFVLDGKTYLFSSDDKTYVCYSTRDYTRPDDGYPKPIDENWWNLPAALLKFDFHHPDAVFIAHDGRIHLFRDNQTISFDHNHRWWSEPLPIQEAWRSLPFATVSAGFTARDGRAYIFTTDNEPSYVRYSDRSFQRVDDRFPKAVKENLGKLVNNIERTGRVDAAVAIVSTVIEMASDGQAGTKAVRYRYLFSGDQFYRYSTDQQKFADEGYPLRIQNNLRREPHFANLDAPAERGIDGVWADSGNVFVFISDQIYAASFNNFRELDGLGIENAQAADVDGGRITVFAKDSWRHILPPEAHIPSAIAAQRPADYVWLLPEPNEPMVPRPLRAAPPKFQGKLSAILRGLDNNVYLFNDKDCYDRSMEQQYPTGSAWGQVRNLIAEDERVDSALLGRDGKLYLFRGDQFISYTPTPDAPTKIPDLADTNPLPISDHWGGLNNVRYSFVQKGVTYLLEAPAKDGSFRYVRYFGTDYSQPNEPAPLSGDFSFWAVPDSSVSRGFDRIDTVLSGDDGLTLFRKDQFIHYDPVADVWSAPRLFSLRWPGLVRQFPDFEIVHAVVVGPDNLTYFFAERAWLSHDGKAPSQLTPISSRWALLYNRITQSNRVDATLVYGDQTFLFSGDEYVRYTGSDYENVDAGYPLPIALNLRRETPFQQLPEDIEADFENLKRDDVWVATALSTGGVVVVQVAGRTFALSAQVSRTYPIQQVTNVRNELIRRARVDAAFAREKDGALFLLSGDQYVRYSQAELDEVDDGYPREIGESLLADLQELEESLAAGAAAGADGGAAGVAQQSRKPSPMLPLAFQENLDAVLYDEDGGLVLFKAKQFIRIKPDAEGGDVAPKDIKGTWGRVSNPFFAPLGDPQPAIDAALVASDHSLYVFKGDQYLRYTDPTALYVDEGYPRAIRDEFADLPDDFKAGVDGAFVFDGRTYLCHDKHYVRYGGCSYSRMDPVFPQLFTNRWCAANDFQLGDLRTIQRYVALDQSHPADSGSLTDFLLARPLDNADPYALLAVLFDWQVQDVQWLKRHDAFLNRPNRDLADEVDFDIALVLRMYDTLQLTGRLGSTPQEVHEQVWSPLYKSASNPTNAANTLQRLLGTLYPGDNWTTIQRQLGDALSRTLRDAQVGWLLANSQGQLADARDLSALVLTDVEVDGSLDTSTIVEAISAVQLYFYRYLMNLEPALAKGDDATKRAAFKEQWAWIQNYRVWEANRKVFLYPESYIRPELRTTRTAAFETLQQNLQQGAITDDSVAMAYQQYLDAYTEVSRLIIAGGYRQPDPQTPGNTELTLFGVTRTDPITYYYRTASFPNDGESSAAVWQAWQALGIQINSDRVYPVRAFGRTFVFWAEAQPANSDPQTSTTLQTTPSKDGNSTQVSQNQPAQYTFTIMYSYCTLSGQWMPPQTLYTSPAQPATIDSKDVQLSVTTTGQDEDESIVVNFVCTPENDQWGKAPYKWSLPKGSSLPDGLNLASDGTVSGTPKATGSSQVQIAVTDSTSQTATGQLQITVDTAPDTTSSQVPIAPISLPDAQVKVSYSQTLPIPINSSSQVPIASSSGLPPSTDAKSLAADLTVSDVTAVSIVDDRANILQSLCPTEITTDPDTVITIDSPSGDDDAPWYSFDMKGGSFLARPVESIKGSASQVTPLALAGNKDKLPKWNQVDAGLDGSDGNQYLFNNLSMVYRTLGEQKDRPINSRWGLRYTTVYADGQVDAAWQRNGVLFLARADKYLKYSSGLDWADDNGDYTMGTQGQADSVPSWRSIDAAFTDSSKTTWFFQGTNFGKVDASNTFTTGQIKDQWGIERNDFTAPTSANDPLVVAAFNRDNRTYLIGPSAYISYANTDLTVCGTPKPQSLRNVLTDLNCSNVTDADASAIITGAMDDGTELLFRVKIDSGKAVYSFADGKVSLFTGASQDVAAFMYNNQRFAFTPANKGFVLTVADSQQSAYSQDISAALLAGDGNLYLFSKDSFITIAAADINVTAIGAAIGKWASSTIKGTWGRTTKPFDQDGRVTAAVICGNNTFLASSDSYVRYSTADYTFIDAGYPKPLAGNPDGLPQVAFTAGVQYPDGSMCYFQGTDYVLSNDLSKKFPNKSKWGLIRSNILVRGVDTAYRVDTRHYLFSGDEIACYTAGADGKIPDYMDSAPFQAALGSLGALRGAFCYGDYFYLVGRDRFVCCTVEQPEQALPEYPRRGEADALVADLCRQFGLGTDPSGNMLAGYQVYALSLQGSILYLDTDDNIPGQQVLQLDLSKGSSGQVTRDYSSSIADWASLRTWGNYSVAVGTTQYTFSSGTYVTTTQNGGVGGLNIFGLGIPGLGGSWRSVSSVWGGRPFDAAINFGDNNLTLLVGDQYCTLPLDQAADSRGVTYVAQNIGTALASCQPIVGGIINIPQAFLDGIDAALQTKNDLYLFSGSQYARYRSGVDAMPEPVADVQYEIVRLTTSTAASLNRAFFADGVPGLLSLATQEVPETPGFSVSTSTPTTIQVNPQRVEAETLPVADHLDFGSANGVYLWEIFYHAPCLIAGMLSTAQQFDLAREWYEYVFDPSEPSGAWKFLPFLSEDTERIVVEINSRLDQLQLPDGQQLRLELAPYTQALLDMNPAFQGERNLSTDETTLLELAGQQIQSWQLTQSAAIVPAVQKTKLLDPALLDKNDLTAAEKAMLKALQAEIANQQTWQPGAQLDSLQQSETDATKIELCSELRELFGLIAELDETWTTMQTSIPQVETYLDDPFDPHAIAALRPIAYRKATVMAYVNNLLSWGDMLFGQYTRESINEAWMLYVAAWDVLGRRPQSLGQLVLPPDSVYDALSDAGDKQYDMLLQLEKTRIAELTFAAELKQNNTGAQAQPYFFIPVNDDLDQYWTQVADRLYKIRNGLNLDGIKEPLPLFQPPINPMDLVNAVAGGGLAGLAAAGASSDVPHYRFNFLISQAQQLAQSVAQLGSELLGAMEKRDAEGLYRLQTMQEGIVLGLTLNMQQSQLADAQANLQSLQQSLANAQKRQQVYSSWVDGDFLGTEIAQIVLLAEAVGMNAGAIALNLLGAPVSEVPKETIGLFTAGVIVDPPSTAMSDGSQALSSTAGVFDGIANILGITAQHQRSMNDWTLQRDLAAIDMDQINAQITGANWQIQAAQQQIVTTQKQIQQNTDLNAYYHSKFTSQELYVWMVSRLSDLHYQTYSLTLDMARAAERAFQFERGSNGSQSFIQSQAWDSQHQGLLSGYTLGLSLQRMQAAFIQTDARRFEITKSISLLQRDPMAFLKLKTESACEFDLGEALFDYDFPGHYCRQVKNVAVDFAIGDGVLPNATLTQLTNRVIMKPDPKAVAFLMSPKQTPPDSIRTDWKAQQQVALSYHTQYETNTGVFQLNFDDERYLPFEGTGAVSRWRLELGGPPGSYDLGNLTDVTITLKYTALQGGDGFAASVRGLLKPSDVLKAFNLSVDFADLWTAFLQGDSNNLQLPLTRALFPSMASSAIRAIFTRYEYVPQTTGGASFVIDMGQQVPLPDGKTTDTSGLMVRSTGTMLNLTVKGDKTTLKNAYLVMGYKGGVR